MNHKISFLSDIDIPKHPGVYIISDGDNVVYVGKAAKLSTRLRGKYHKAEEINALSDPKIDYVLCDKDEINIVESLLIIDQKPRLNSLIMKCSKRSKAKSVTRNANGGIRYDGRQIDMYRLSVWLFGYNRDNSENISPSQVSSDHLALFTRQDVRAYR